MFRLVIYPKPVLCFVPVVYHGPVVQAGLAVPGRVSKPSILPRLPKEAASFVLQTESRSLCSVSMCSKDKTQENSCCLLTLIVGIIGKWSKQEITNAFSSRRKQWLQVAAWRQAVMMDGPVARAALDKVYKVHKFLRCSCCGFLSGCGLCRSHGRGVVPSLDLLLPLLPPRK